MSKPPDEIERLIAKSLNEGLTATEKNALDVWLNQSEENRLLYRLYTDEFEEEEAGEIEKLESERGWELLNSKINKQETATPGRRITAWTKYAMAACILIAACIIYVDQYYKKDKPALNAAVQPETPGEILPGGNKATLTLSDGSVIVLDSAGRGNIARQGSTRIIKLDSGELAYNTTNEKPGEVLYNTLATPIGGQYNITLPDGSRVWLNAASSLRFPAAFVGTERTVELTGEAYFEVKPLTLKGGRKTPFIVKINDMEVQVLGTHFNIGAYNNEALVKTTLLEGSVNVTNGEVSSILKPGEQAQLYKEGNIKVVKDADTEQAVAWKNGYFQFNRDDIETIMHQMERWYGIEAVYEKNKPTERYAGSISRNNNLAAVLQMLEQSGLQFKLNGKKLIVIQ